MSWWNDFEPICEQWAPLAPLTWYRLGGAARWLLRPRGSDELAALIRRLHYADTPWRILGKGANLIVRDSGFDGAVILLDDAAFKRVAFDHPCVTLGAGVDFARFVPRALRRDLTGLETLAGIPGTIGGIVRMNAGGRYGEIAEFVRSITVVDARGIVQQRSANQIEFRYRHTNLSGHAIVDVRLELRPGDGLAAGRRYREIWREKHAAQPAVAHRSAGCIFKNPPNDSAGRLLDLAGLKALRVGCAEISSRHANFIIAREGATASDVLALIDVARQRVRDASGVELQLEVDVW